MNDTKDGGRKLRVKERKTYTDQEIDDDEIEGKRSYKIEDKVSDDRHNKEYVQYLRGEEFNLRYMQENGLKFPILFEEKAGLGLRVPSLNFKVSDVKACVGSRRMLDVMDVNTQKGLEMTMKDWVKYYESLDRDRLLNVISLEFSHTKLENYVESPNLVREVDWVDTAWPQHLKDCQTESTNAIDKMKYPKVQKYCLMSVGGCYTDFHIDFGGTSVWYHILHGEKIFWLIPPTDRNLTKYENWVLSGKQGDMFLADEIDECQKVHLRAGNTFIIPSGWIHAVYTPMDSLVFGGNFLHSYNMVNQVRASLIEDKTHVPMKFRYPFFAEIHWYVLERYVHSLTGITYLEKPKLNEEMELICNKSEKETSLEDIEEKLNKRLSVSLTRIDESSPGRRKSSSDEDSMASGPTRSPDQTGKCPFSRHSSSESSNSNDAKFSEEKIKGPYKSPVKMSKKHVHLTKFELEGLTEAVAWVESMPPTKKGVPKDLMDPHTVLSEIKRLIQEHCKDNPELAVTGEPVLEWTKATKKLIKLKQKAKTAKLLGSMGGSQKAKGAGKVASGSRRRRVRCKQCEPCTRDDCMECNFCKDMRKYGGPGTAKQSCISRQCLRPVLPKSAVCQLCNQVVCRLERPMKADGSVSDEEDYLSAMMECGLCWEIVHPLCLSRKFENLNNDGIINEDLPNSWKCAKCCYNGKEGQLKTRVFKGGWRPNPTCTPPPLSESPPPLSDDSQLSPVNADLIDDIITEGKRVTVNQAIEMDKKEKMMKVKEGEEQMENTVPEIRDLKPELPVKSEPADSRVKMPVKSEPADSRVKRKHSPDPHSKAKKKRDNSPAQTKANKTPRQSSKSSMSAKPLASNSMKESSGSLKRSKREVATVPFSYDFDDDDKQMMDISSPLPEKTKGKFKGKKSLYVKDANRTVYGTPLAKVNKSGDSFSSSMRKNADKVDQEQLRQTLLEHIEKRNLPKVLPRFAARPAPVTPPDEYFCQASGSRHPLPCKLWTYIFSYLQQRDLSNCLLVCRTWNCWCISPDLWQKIDLSRRRIVQAHLIALVRRQPVGLNLNAVTMTQKQIWWLLERLPHLRTLLLSKCSWVTLSGLCMSSCPLLHTLDISWATGLNDKCFEDLITPPVDRKPAILNISRLHKLKSLNVSGSEISDASLSLLTNHVVNLEHLNISYCTKITDRGIEALVGNDSSYRNTLTNLNISGCRQLSDAAIDAIGGLTNLQVLSTLHCIRISHEKCSRFNHIRYLKEFNF